MRGRWKCLNGGGCVSMGCWVGVGVGVGVGVCVGVGVGGSTVSPYPA